ncbi:hypothetical protein RV13_GL001744 [Enterococcus raffinosus]|nr:hypothetical protein RV13_GL001744 [Enterococcus raffinosus]
MKKNKTFKDVFYLSIKGKVRNRRSRFTLRMNLIAGIYNYELLS